SPWSSCRSPSRPSRRRASRQVELAASDGDRRAADVDLVLRVRDREERRRAPDLAPLPDLDLLAERDSPVPREMERERPGGRAGGGILVDAVRGDEDAHLPRRAVAREAHRPERRQLEQGADVGPQRGDRLGRVELDEDVARPLEIGLDRQPGLADAEQREQLVRALVRLVGEGRLAHPAERDPRAVAPEPHGNDARAGLEPDLLQLQRAGEDERRPENRVPGEGQLERRREDPDPHVPLGVGRVDEDGLREVDLAREQLQHLLRDLARVGEHGELVPRERHVGEDVGHDVAERRHAADCNARPVYPSPRMLAIEVSGLRKAYGDLEAVRGVDFTIEEGEVFGLLGPNGAGKTTTVEILEGYRRRDAGEVRVLGSDPGKPAQDFRERIGVVLQQSDLWPNLTVREIHAIFAGYYGAPRDVDEVVALVGLEEKAGARVKTLSGGQKRRLDLGIALVGDPDLVFLDEPTTGFDPQARRAAWEMIRSLRSLGKTVLLTTHYLDEAEQLSDRVAVMREGQIVRIGTPAELTTTELQTEIRYLRDGEEVLLQTNEPTRVLAELTTEAVARGEELEGLSVRRP